MLVYFSFFEDFLGRSVTPVCRRQARASGVSGVPEKKDSVEVTSTDSMKCSRSKVIPSFKQIAAFHLPDG